MIEFGDCRETMRRWKERGVKAQTCVTSPPYYGLRDYGHDGQIGLEETPDEYIKAMVEVFRCVWDVLEDDGTLWLNIGDSYAGSGKGRNADGSHQEGGKQGTNKGTVLGSLLKTQTPDCKPKDLIGIPWMLAFALRADGWYLRQDIIWHKPNPMPESVQDRCTKAHEYIFLLSKSPKYYYDIESIKEPALDVSLARMQRGVSDTHKNVNGAPGQTPHSMNKPRPNMKNVQPDGQTPNSFHVRRQNGEADKVYENRNKRSVWTVNTKPYKGAHFATFPPALIAPCILAGSPVDGVVFDPFMGSGTTAAVAIANGRRYLGCELNPAYKELQDERIKNALNETSQMDLL
jgi:DNA modification methylase